MYGLGSHSIDQTLQLFGIPKSVTALSRSLITKSDDSFTILLQYGGEQEDLICTIKTTVVAPVDQAFASKFWVRGMKGVFIKVSTLSSPGSAGLTSVAEWRRRAG